ncbi:MAG: hypothetical protein WAL63_20405 [Solirubrobacteraceae bacterium]
MNEPAPDPVDLSPAETERIRERVRRMLEISARSGRFRGGLLQATARLTPEEAAIVADLERHGLDVTQLRDLLQGAHVLVDQPELYERWLFPDKSHQRISSHHPEIDKRTYPDFGMRGPLVREKLHGRTAHGTWLQLEKTPATMTAGKRKPPTLTDLKHLVDYVIYRVTRSNVGPWGRSGATERRPMYLSPDLGVRVPIPPQVSDELTSVISSIEESDDVTSASPDLAERFPPPDRANDLQELTFTGVAQGRGLFGASSVWSTSSSSRSASDDLHDGVDRSGWSPPDPGLTRETTVRLNDDHELAYAVRLTEPVGPSS